MRGPGPSCIPLVDGKPARLCKTCGIVMGVKCLRCPDAHGKVSSDGKRCTYCAEHGYTGKNNIMRSPRGIVPVKVRKPRRSIAPIEPPRPNETLEWLKSLVQKSQEESNAETNVTNQSTQEAPRGDDC